MAHILVLGAGAIGSTLGALLQEAGDDVFLIARGRHLQHLQAEGLRLTGGGYGPDRTVPVHAGLQPPAGFRPDLVIVATKTQDLERALDEHAAAFGEAPVVALQNGLAQDDIVRKVVGDVRAVACVTALDATFLEPGVVSCERPGALVLGGAVPAGGPSAAAAASYLDGGLEVHHTDNAQGARWTKLLINLGNVVPALTGMPFQSTSAHPLLSKVHVHLIREGLRVAKAEGVRLESLPWTSAGLLSMLGKVPVGIGRKVFAARAKRVLGEAPFYGSTWQSLERGREPETAWLNGEVVRRGARHGVPTPVNAAALALIEGERPVEPEKAVSLMLADV